MMTSSNGNIFRVTGPLCGEFTGPGEFPTQRPVTRSFDVFFDLRLNKRLSKHSCGWWFETLSWSLWRHHNDSTGIRSGMSDWWRKFFGELELSILFFIQYISYGINIGTSVILNNYVMGSLARYISLEYELWLLSAGHHQHTVHISLHVISCTHQCSPEPRLCIYKY